MNKHEVWSAKKLNQASKHLLRVDEKLSNAVEQKGVRIPVERLLPKKGEDLFSVLARSIVFQQLSGASARAIWKRFLKSTGDTDKPDPGIVARLSVDDMRSVGLSRQKGRYLKDLSSQFVSGRLSDEILSKMNTDEVTRRLLSVKGIGLWTLHMFEIFHLGRQDVLPTGDLAILRGIQKLYDLVKPPTPKQAEDLTEHWKPYRSLGSFYIWVCF